MSKGLKEDLKEIERIVEKYCGEIEVESEYCSGEGYRNKYIVNFIVSNVMEDEMIQPCSIDPAPKHYDNTNGSLYKIATERGWNPYLFDIVKRLERSEKKGEFESDLNKSKHVIDLWLKETNN